MFDDAGGRVLGYPAPRSPGDHPEVHEQAGENGSPPPPVNMYHAFRCSKSACYIYASLNRAIRVY